MEETSCCRERYRMKFIFYIDNGSSSTTNSPETAAVASPRSKSYVVCVRLSNTEAKPLTKHNVQVLSLSIPDLHQRITGRPRPFVFHKAYLHWEALSREPSAPAPNPSTPSGQLSSLVQWVLPPKAVRHHRESLANRTPPLPANPNKEEPPSSSSSSSKKSEAQPPDWLQCDGSFIPDVSIKEWAMVSYQGEDFTRCISPLAYTDDAGDIAGRCNVTDYTEYGQLVFSVDVDFLRLRSEAGSHDAADPAAMATEEEEKMGPLETPPSGMKMPRHRRRLSTPKRRSSGARLSTPNRSPIRM
ncbi:hypothetical protein ACEWY4_001796 [Coilia grayii]|uniref:Uncharacterized protein n=1 Tax=Coilia grayii TaxID=363190 RepID=A0ABD1KTY6_9TELE